MLYTDAINNRYVPYFNRGESRIMSCDDNSNRSIWIIFIESIVMWKVCFEPIDLPWKMRRCLKVAVVLPILCPGALTFTAPFRKVLNMNSDHYETLGNTRKLNQQKKAIGKWIGEKKYLAGGDKLTSNLSNGKFIYQSSRVHCFVTVCLLFDMFVEEMLYSFDGIVIANLIRLIALCWPL